MKWLLILSCVMAMGLMRAAKGQSFVDSLDNPLYLGEGEVTRPTKAAMLSAVFPGAGQVYNKKYWKLPFVYGGFVTAGLIIEFNHRNYLDFRNALVFISDADPTTTNDGTKFEGVDPNGLRRARDFYRRNRDYAVILSTAFYGLVIVDAVVDSHLNSFDVSPDLTMRIRSSAEPIMGGYQAVGAGLVFTF